MRRRGFVMIWVLALASAMPASAQPAGKAGKPNIVLILTDQQNASMLGCAGNRWLKTPAMDGLAATGARFERAFCANPVCVPSRFAMMTGVMPTRIGMDNNRDIGNPVPAHVMRHAMGAVFRNAGYETVYGGKTHLPGGETGPAAYGFKDLSRDQRGELARACAAYLCQPHDRPFLLVASFINPHDICYMAIQEFEQAQGARKKKPKAGGGPQVRALEEAMRLPAGVPAAEFYQKLCPPLPANLEISHGEPPALRTNERGGTSPRHEMQQRWSDERWRLHRWAYARLTERVDAEIGVVLKALRESGLADKTLVIFTSDHGEMDGAHRLGQKGFPYEEAIHVPLLVSWPGVTRAGHVDSTHLVSSGLDLIPTMCDFAGIPIPKELKGRSVRPLALGNAVSDWREDVAVEIHGARALRTTRYKYAVYPSGTPRELLVDLRSDPGEMRNLATSAEHRDLLEQMRGRLAAWYRQHNERLDPQYSVAAPAAK